MLTWRSAVTIQTPVAELKATLTGKYGEDTKLIYDLVRPPARALGAFARMGGSIAARRRPTKAAKLRRCATI